MINPIIIGTKGVSKISKLLNLGHGSTWPGHMALSIKQDFISDILKKNKHLKVVLIVGTNGKTTTAKLLRYILEKNGLKVFQNDAGANLLNGIASTLIINSNLNTRLPFDVAVFEVDENTLPHIVKHVRPDILLILNLFRDQLDRYGEVNTIADKWLKTLKTLSNTTHLFINGDDPKLSFITTQSPATTTFFGLEDERMSKKALTHDVDFSHCPKCDTKLNFEKISYSHMGKFKCPHCRYTNPKKDFLKNLFYPLFGKYNEYNVNAAALIANTIFKIDEEKINSALQEFKPAFGRQEVLSYKGKKVVILLSKNPTSFNQSLQAVKEQNGRYLFLVLNDRIPDGRDVSWIWDVDTEEIIPALKSITISGDRAYDMGVRIKYSNSSEFKISNLKFKIEDNLDNAINNALSGLESNDTLYILPTYSAMLEVRQILTGKKIL